MKRFVLFLLATMGVATAQANWLDDLLRGRSTYVPPAGPYVVNRTDDLPIGRSSVIVFVGANCPSCAQAVEDTRNVGILVPVEVQDVSSSGFARDNFMRLGGRAIPMTVTGSQMLIGRDPRQLKTIAGAAGMARDDAPGN